MTINRTMREWLLEAYLMWKNQYLTTAKFAEHHGLTEDEASRLIELARDVASHEHPDM